MKKSLIILLIAGVSVMSCAKQSPNPFFNEYETPFGVPPFDKIKEEHYLPAFEKGIVEQNKEIQAIVSSQDEPTFENSVVALEESGALLTKVSDVFYNMTSAKTSDRVQEIAREASPLLSQHHDDIMLNPELFQRIKTVYDQRNALDLTPEQSKLLMETYKEFVRSGANLNDEDKAKLRELNKQLSMLSLQFGENVLDENNEFELVIEDKSDLSGLPESVTSAAAETATERGHDGAWVFTLHKPSLIPFLQYSEKRNLREKMFKGYINRGDHDNKYDNKSILKKMVSLRVKRAHLLGFKSHADYILAENMAKNPENVYDLLDKVWKPAINKAKQEAKELQGLIDEEGKSFELQPWDWWYYAEKLRKQKYDLDDSMLRPYFPLGQVRKGAFEVAHRLYGLTFEERTDIPKYDKDVRVFEVKDNDGSHLGILYTDYYPRASKEGGAWMNSFRKESHLHGKQITPVIANVFNFTKPTGDSPALLSFEEVTTLFHEFGHALHGLLSNCTYPSLSGTAVPRDFVELPSQVMENWAAEPAVLKMYAKHYKTGAVIPDELIEKIQKARHFNQGFATVEYLAASYLDMNWHTLTDTTQQDVHQFENQSLDQIGLIPEIVVRYRSPYFSHIFAGGYSSGYYSYIWAEVLDADAFQAFKETSLFDQKTATAFRENVLERGGTEDPMVLYKRFRGAEPSIEPLLERRGLN